MCGMARLPLPLAAPHKAPAHRCRKARNVLREDQLTSEQLADLTDRRLTRLAIVANGTGSLLVTAFITVFVVSASGIDLDLLLLNLPAAATYLVLTLIIGIYYARRHLFAPLDRWLREDRPATEEERSLALRYPYVTTGVAGFFWGLAAPLVGLINWGNELAVPAVATLLLGGLTTCAIIYLLGERIMRPVIARALESGRLAAPVAPGVSARLVMSWALATGVPLVGIAAMAVLELKGESLFDGDPAALAATVLFLTVLAIGVGLAAVVLAARSVADPVASVAEALERVEQGDYDARVIVDDGSEVGLLEAGFNRMAAGLAERERLRDLFGRHVGRDVAEAALDGDARLGGEQRDVSVLFADVIASTSLGDRYTPAQVVGLLNSFFRLVVEVAEHHGGWVNKFEGDAALCVFGAPASREDPAGDALACARELSERMRRELPQIEVGIGISAGPVIAGNVGSEQRYEYTVIGDPVNEAARLCELAKRRPEHVLASEDTLQLAGESEAQHWGNGEVVTLRGRREPTRLITPAPSASRAA